MTLLHVSPGMDIYTTSATEDGPVPRPPGEGWSLVATLVGNGLLFVWTRSQVIRDHERASELVSPEKWLDGDQVLAKDCPVCKVKAGHKCQIAGPEGIIDSFSVHRGRIESRSVAPMEPDGAVASAEGIVIGPGVATESPRHPPIPLADPEKVVKAKPKQYKLPPGFFD